MTQQDYANLAAGQHMIEQMNREVGLRAQLLAAMARIADLEADIAARDAVVPDAAAPA